jgi:hypothetical protein
VGAPATKTSNAVIPTCSARIQRSFATATADLPLIERVAAEWGQIVQNGEITASSKSFSRRLDQFLNHLDRSKISPKIP